MIGIIEVLAVEQQQSNDTATDCCIRKIEYRAEENEMFSTDKRHPCGPVCINDGEIEHIHHLAITTGISPPSGMKEAICEWVLSLNSTP